MFTRTALYMEPEAPTAGSQDGQAGNDGANAATSATSARSRGEGEGQAPESQDDGKFDLNSLDPKVQNYIKSLRQEAAGHRTATNQMKMQFEDLQGRLKSVFGGETDEVPVEDRLAHLAETADTLSFQNAVLQTALSNGISGEGLPYMQFLLQQATGSLEEGEEMDEGRLAAIIEEVKSKSSRPAFTNSSVGSPRGPSNAAQNITVEQFSRMGITERTALYRKNESLYESLMQASKSKAQKR